MTEPAASSIVTAVGTAFQGVQTDVMSMVTTILPIALGIVGVFLAVKFGIKFFKQTAK